MKVSCEYCPIGSPKTDRILLININGRDCLVCVNCAKRNGLYHGKSQSRKNILRYKN